MGWIIYNSRGEPLVTQEQHDHTAADASGPMTDDEHDGFSEYDELATPANPAANKMRFYPVDVGGVTGWALLDSAGTETQIVARTRYIWVPAREFNSVLGTPIYANVGAWSNDAWGWWLRDASTDAIQAHFALPADYVPGTPIKCYLLYGSGGAGNFWATVRWAAVTADNTETMAQNGDATEDKAIAANANATLVYYSNVDITPAAGDFVNMAIYRQGAHGNDTSANNMVVFGVRVSYTAFF